MKPVQIIGTIASIIIFIFVFYMNFGGGIENQVVQDSIDEYEMVKRGGDKTDMCVYAGMVKAACTLAGDTECFDKWAAIEKRDCAAHMKQYR